ncbi:MAG: Uma2 family endonuclease [Dermatophilus congolensis]|nr:Uma2 family endonuclease [Dermatophilus congolensis]
MTTATVNAVLPLVDLAEWDADWSQREEDYELVAGIPALAPGEIYDNRNAALELAVALRRITPAPARVLIDFDVQLSAVPATVRRPDVLVLASPLPNARRAMPEDVLFVAEVVSPSSTVTDWRYKRQEYAQAGIPVYLVADIREGSQRLTLFKDPTDGVYPDPPPTDGTSVTIAIGASQITVRLSDLLA